MADLDVRQYEMVEIIRQAKYEGITKSELKSCKGDRYDSDVEALLLKNKILTYDPVEERFSYNFDPRFRNKENLENALREESCINVDESLRNTYTNILEDAEV